MCWILHGLGSSTQMKFRSSEVNSQERNSGTVVLLWNSFDLYSSCYKRALSLQSELNLDVNNFCTRTDHDHSDVPSIIAVFRNTSGHYHCPQTRQWRCNSGISSSRRGDNGGHGFIQPSILAVFLPESRPFHGCHEPCICGNILGGIHFRLANLAGVYYSVV